MLVLSQSDSLCVLALLEMLGCCSSIRFAVCRQSLLRLLQANGLRNLALLMAKPELVISAVLLRAVIVSYSDSLSSVCQQMNSMNVIWRRWRQMRSWSL